MKKIFENDYISAVNKLSFSRTEKERMTEMLIRSANNLEKSERTDVHSVFAKRFVKVFASAAAAIAVFSGVCVGNPAFAARIPLIGQVFSNIENDVTFSGNYSESNTVLTSENINGVLTNYDYSVSSSGVSITASEVYCDGRSVFLTVNIDVENGGLANVPEHYTDGFDKTAATVYAYGVWGTENETQMQKLIGQNFEGKVIDDNTFIGMIKLDLSADMAYSDGILKLALTGIGFDDITDQNTENEVPSNQITGNWILSVPYSVNTSATEIINVNDSSDNGYGIESVLVSPYQICVSAIKPNEIISREDYEKLYPESEGFNTYDDYIKEKELEVSTGIVMIFNQDGEKLDLSDSQDGNSYIFPVKNVSLEELHIYILSTDEGNENESACRENALYQKNISLETYKTE